MEKENLMKVYVLVRRVYNLLCEVLDISNQLSDAVNRNDVVSMQILLDMRSEPIQQLAVISEQIQELLANYPVEDANHLRKLLNGEPATTECEKNFANQIATNSRVWHDVIELDKKLNLQIAHNKSIYREKQ